MPPQAYRNEFAPLLAAMCMYAQIPLAIDLLALYANPFLMGTLYLLVHVLTLYLYIYICFRKSRGLTITNIGPGFRHQIGQLQQSNYPYVKVKVAILLLAVPEYAYLAWAAQSAGTAISTMLFQLWPVIFILVSSKLLDKARAETPIDILERSSKHADYILPSAMAFIGVTLVIASKHDWVMSTSAVDVREVWFGVGLAGCGAVAAAIIPYYNLSMGQSIANTSTAPPQVDSGSEGNSTRSDAEGDRDPDEEVYQILYAKLTSTRCAMPIVLTLAILLYLSDTQSGGGLGLAALLASLWIGTVLTLGAVFFRSANRILENRAKNAIFYFTPLLALLLLWRFGSIDVVHFDYFLMGALVIASANIVINTSADDRHHSVHLSFRGLIFAAWAAGAFVYSRDRFLDIETLAWPHENYWALLGVLSTVFILIYSFRTSRIANRITTEEERITQIVAEASDLVSRNVCERDLLDHLILGDAARNPSEARFHYESVFRRIRAAVQRHSGNLADSERLSSLQQLTNAHFQSRQRGREFSEVVALSILASVMCAVAVLARPTRAHPGSGSYEPMLIEFFAITFVAVIVFLLLDLVDRRNSRDASSFAYANSSASLDSLLLRFTNATVEKWERVASLAAFALLYVAFAYLLYRKWLLLDY